MVEWLSEIKLLEMLNGIKGEIYFFECFFIKTKLIDFINDQIWTEFLIFFVFAEYLHLQTFLVYWLFLRVCSGAEILKSFEWWLQKKLFAFVQQLGSKAVKGSLSCRILDQPYPIHAVGWTWCTILW